MRANKGRIIKNLTKYLACIFLVKTIENYYKNADIFFSMSIVNKMSGEPFFKGTEIFVF